MSYRPGTAQSPTSSERDCGSDEYLPWTNSTNSANDDGDASRFVAPADEDAGAPFPPDAVRGYAPILIRRRGRIRLRREGDLYEVILLDRRLGGRFGISNLDANEPRSRTPATWRGSSPRSPSPIVPTPTTARRGSSCILHEPVEVVAIDAEDVQGLSPVEVGMLLRQTTA